MNLRQSWPTALAVAASVLFVWFTFVNVSDLLGEPFFGFKENMDKFSYSGLALFLAVEVGLVALIVFALRLRRRSRP
jgi:hypothetical protein